MKVLFSSVVVLGLSLVVGSSLNLRQHDELRHNRNVLGIQQSGYGMLLARLSQDTLNKVWHYGIEEVGADHEHGPDCGHDHAHGEACDHGDHSGSTLASTPEDHGHSHDHDGHEHVHSEHCAHGDDCDHTDHPADTWVFHVEDEPHVHGPDGDHEAHEHSAESLAAVPSGLLGDAMNFIEQMRMASLQRTNQFSLTEAHKATVAQDIETMLLRSYRMDPTDYGVYNAYHLFLTIHELAADGVALEQARRISEITIQTAQNETESPFAWLTAASAFQDLFFQENQQYMARGEKIPHARTAMFRGEILRCLQMYESLRDSASADGRWHLVGEPRREEAEQRYRFLTRSSVQFDVMLGEAIAP